MTQPISSGTTSAATAPGFAHIDTWIFDLDNTLYPASCNLFAQVDHRMGEFIARYLGVPYQHARHLQKAYYRQFGTTLAGLMKVHKLAPESFLDYVHDIDLSAVPELPALAASIAKLPGRRLIFTNGSRRHAENVAAKIGVRAEIARELAYRLYAICERKKRAAEALAYNGLVQSWPELLKLAGEQRSSAPLQQGMDI